MSTGAMIGLLCGLCLVPLWAAASLFRFALGMHRCSRRLDDHYYYDDGGGSGGARDDCPASPHGPRDDRGEDGPEDDSGRYGADWWPQFERELGRYVQEQESCPSGRGATATEPGSEASGTPTRA